jgi:Flp pilus assembly secretin CpaC
MGHVLLRRLAAVSVLCAAMIAPALAGDKVAVHAPATEPIKLTAGKQTIFRSPTNVHRTLVADPGVCGVNQFSARELAIVARAPGKTEVTIWLSDSEMAPLIYIVEVRSAAP